MKIINAVALLCLFSLLNACGSGGETDTTTVIEEPTRYPRFSPVNGIFPYPNNLLFRGSEDGTLNAPYDPDASVALIYEPLNSLDGFSTIAPITVSFNVQPGANSLKPGETVRLFEVTLAGVGGAVTSVTRELDESEYALSLDNSAPSQLVITPTRALAPKTSYLAVLTNGLADEQGSPFEASTVYSLTKSTTPLINAKKVSQIAALTNEEAVELESVRLLNVAAESAVIQFDPSLKRDDIVLSWTFTTQSVNDVLLALRDAINSAPPPSTTLSLFVRTDPGFEGVSVTPNGGAWIYTGTITLPYYSPIPSPPDEGLTEEVRAEPVRTGYWHGPGDTYLTAAKPIPVPTDPEHEIPLLVTIPTGSSKPEGGWPVVIFQHGNTSNRAALVAFADTLAESGFAAVAIDLPMHGITGDEKDGSQLLRQSGLERTFDLDVFTDKPAPEVDVLGSDGKIDMSGTFFTQLAQPLTTRDNMRQAVADLMGLRRSLAAMDYDGGGPDFDTSQIRFIGHSLGASVGAVYLGVEKGSDVSAATLGMPGGAIAKQMDGSAVSGPSVKDGLATNSIIKGTPSYERFLAAVQMVLDSADPLNYAKTAADRALHMIEVVGSETSLPDQIVPNNVLNAVDTVPSPTAGTDPLWNAMGLSIASASIPNDGNDTPLKVVVRFNAGHHSSLISTFDADGKVDALSERVQIEMQGQTAAFLFNGGKQLTITDDELIEKTEP